MNRDEILEMIVKHTVSSRIEQGTDLIHEVYVNDFVDELVEAINVIQCCTQLKAKEALTFDEFKDEFYYKAQMGIYESKASGMFYNLNDLNKRYQKYCLRF